MSDQIKGIEIIEKDFLKNPTNDLDKFAAAIDNVNDKLDSFISVQKDIAKLTPLDSFENIEKVNKALVATNKSVKLKNDLAKKQIDLAKQQEKLQQEREKSLQQEIKSEGEIEKAIQQENKTRQESEKIKQQELKTDQEVIKTLQQEEKLSQQVAKGKRDEIKEAERLEKNRKRAIDSQEKLNKREKEAARLSVSLKKDLKELEKQYKDLVLAEGFTADGVEDIAREIADLDKQLKAVDDSLKDVKGSGEDAAKGIKGIGTALKVSGIAAVVAIFAAIADQFKSTREGALEFAKAINRVTAFVKVFATSAVQAFSGVKQAVTGVFEAIGNQADILGVKFELLLEKSLSLFSDESAENAKKLEKQLEELQSKTFGISEGIDAATGAFDNYNERVSEVIKSNDILLEQTLKFTIAIEEQERQLATLNKQRELAREISDDDTLSFQKRLELSAEVARLNIEVADKELDIARKRLELSEQEIKTELSRAGITVTSRQQIIDILNDQDKALKVSDEASRSFTDNFIALSEAQGEAELSRFDQQLRLRKLEQDLRERDLDILIDGFDNQKTINERRIANEQETLKDRREILEETQRLSDASLNAQVETLQMFTKEQIDINDLLATSDAVLLNQKIRSLGLSEILEGRLLEVIRDRRTATQDLTEANQDLSDSEREANEIREDIAAQRVALANTTLEKLEALEKDRTDNEIENLRERLELAKEGSLEALQIEQELNNKLLEAQQERLDKEKEQEEDAAEQRKELALAGVDALAQIEQDASNKRIEAFDKEIQTRIDNQARLIEKANAGVLGAQESLANEQAEQAKLELARQKEQEQQEKILAGFKILSALIDGGLSPSQAIPQTGALLAALPAVIRALPSFDVGTENTSTGANVGGVDGKGGFHAILHPNERVMTDEQNNMIPSNMSNWELANLAATYGNSTNSIDRTVVEMPRFTMQPEMMGILKEIRDKPTLTDVKLDLQRQIAIETIKSGNKTTNIHKKSGGIW